MRKTDAAGAAAFLQTQDNILILTHRNPDGDTLGGAFALLRALLALGKTARVVCAETIPEKYAYMWAGLADASDFTPDCVVAVDIAAEKLLGESLQARFGGKIDLCIDHHVSNTQYAKTLFLEECAATCEMVYAVVSALGCAVTVEIADCLYTGLATDTGCFRYTNVTARTHEIAAELIRVGAHFGDINRVMFETKTGTYLKLQELVLKSLEMYFDGRCAVITITQEMFRQSGSNESECDGIASLPRKIEGVLVGVTLRERDDGTYKVSLRTYEPIDASKICMALGGGGHARAAGCELKSDDLAQEKQRLLSVIRTELKNI